MGGSAGRARRARLRGAAGPARRRRVPRLGGAVRRRRGVPLAGRHGAAQFRQRRIQISALSAAGAGRGAAAGALPALGAARQRMARAAAPRAALSGRARRLSRALPRRRPASPDAADPEIPGRRLQLPAPGPLWRTGLPAAGDGPAQRAGERFRRRRVHAGRAAAAHAVARRDRAARPGRRSDLRGQPPPGRRHARRSTASTMRHGVSRLRSGSASRSASSSTTRREAVPARLRARSLAVK